MTDQDLFQLESARQMRAVLLITRKPPHCRWTLAHVDSDWNIQLLGQSKIRLPLRIVRGGAAILCGDLGKYGECLCLVQPPQFLDRRRRGFSEAEARNDLC